MTKKETTTETSALNRDNLRALAAELNQLGIKEILGFIIKSKQDKGALLLDLEDAVNEIFVAQRNKDFAGAIQRPGAQAAWDSLALKYIVKKGPTAQSKKIVKDKIDSILKGDDAPIGSEPETDMDGCRYSAPDTRTSDDDDNVNAPIRKKATTIDAVLVKIRETKNAAARATRDAKKVIADKKPRDTFWTWILDRVSNPQTPPTREAILAEMAIRSPEAKPKSLATCLAGVKKWKWTKLDVLLVEDKDGLFSVGESRK